jgi:hypothetical protein
MSLVRIFRLHLPQGPSLPSFPLRHNLKTSIETPSTGFQPILFDISVKQPLILKTYDKVSRTCGALTNRILELETNMINIRQERDRGNENARAFNADLFDREDPEMARSPPTLRIPTSTLATRSNLRTFPSSMERTTKISMSGSKRVRLSKPTQVLETPNFFEFSLCYCKVTPPSGSQLWVTKVELVFKIGKPGKQHYETVSTFPTTR